MFDVEGFVEREFPEYRRSGDEIQTHCPQCSDNHFHFYINVEKGLCHCFKCGYSRNIVGLVIDLTGLSYYRALGELSIHPSLRHLEEKLGRLKKTEELPAYQVQLPAGFENLSTMESLPGKMAKKYLAGRGFGGWHIQRHNLGMAYSVPWRIVIPIEYDYWQARSLLKSLEPKYVNPKSPAKAAIFNSFALQLYEEVVICEGAFSAMAVGEHAIALIGKEVPEEKFERLAQASVKRYAVALDSDAKKFAAALAERLSRSGKEVEVWDYHEGDPAENDGIVEHKQYSFRTKVEMRMKGNK